MLGVSFIAFTFWEFDMTSVSMRYVRSSPPPGIYQWIKDDREDFAVLELPNSYFDTGEFCVNAQYYLLFQPFHKKPLVLGFASRYLPESISFTQKTDFLYELTHPWLLRRLEDDPKLKERRDYLVQQGSRILRNAGIKYVTYHPSIPDTPLLKPEVELLKKWLDMTLGHAVATDEDDNLLYRVK